MGLLAGLVLVSAAAPSAVRAGVVAGFVTDSTTGAPLEGAAVHAVREGGEPAGRTIADAEGRYRITGLPAAAYMLVASRMGMERRRSGPHALAEGETLRVDLGLAPGVLRLNPVQVTASRRSEKALASPVAISVVGARAIAERPAVTPVDHLRSVPGLDIATKGIAQASVVARGFNSAQSSAMLLLSDYRQSSIPSLRYNLFQFLPAPNEDLERIEVVRGPGAALYGPNTDRGVVHFLSRSPLHSPGIAASVTGGDRDAFQGALRLARAVGSEWGVKLTARYAGADDWQYVDPVEASNRASAIAGGADPETLRIGRREVRNERAGGEAHVEWRPDGRTAITAAGGTHVAIHDLEQTPIGAVQGEDWRSSYVQLRGTRGKLFAQAFLNASHAGDTYFLRSGAPVVDDSRFWAAQVQHAADAGRLGRLTYGLDAQWTDPRTDGSVMGRNEDGDRIHEVGGYLQSETRLGSDVDAVAAIRVDDHSAFEDPVFSPRAALVVRPNADAAWRLTYNRAFGTPASDDLFADLLVDSLRPLPYAARVEGVPESGFSFRRGATGPLMRSPFTPSGAGGPATYLPPDATLLWDAVVAIAQSQGVDISGIPAPTSADVASELRSLQSSGAFATVADVADLPALEPTITNSVEVGYRGLVGSRLRVTVDAHRTWVENFVGHLRVITPNVFLEPGSLEAYLGQYMSPGAADSLARSLSGIPLGTVSPQEARDPTDLILAVRNFGSVAFWGMDVACLAQITDRISVAGTYSWVSDDLFHSVDGLEDLAMNAPAGKGSVAVAYRDPVGGLSGEARFRAAAGFPVISGVYVGEVEAYGLYDLLLSYRFRASGRTTVTAAAENLFDDRHQEFTGAPEIGRTILLRLAAEF